MRPDLAPVLLEWPHVYNVDMNEFMCIFLYVYIYKKKRDIDWRNHTMGFQLYVYCIYIYVYCINIYKNL